jgi:hypothetical protein
LQADYRLKRDLLNGRMFLIHTAANSVVMKLNHARNFRLHNMLYALGKFETRPLLPVLPLEQIASSPLAEIRVDLIDALWLSYLIFGSMMPLPGVSEHLLALSDGITPLGHLKSLDPFIVDIPDKYVISSYNAPFIERQAGRSAIT